MLILYYTDDWLPEDEDDESMPEEAKRWWVRLQNNENPVAEIERF